MNKKDDKIVQKHIVEVLKSSDIELVKLIPKVMFFYVRNSKLYNYFYFHIS